MTLGQAEEAEESRPSGSVAAGDLLTTMCRGSLTTASYSENGPLTVLGEAEEAEESHLSGSVAASAGDLLTTMCRGSPTSLADSENGPLTVLGEAEEAEESRPSGPGATLLVIRGSTVHSSASLSLLIRLTRGFPVSPGCTCQCAVPLRPPIIGPLLTESASGVWAGGPLSS
jgi:hypothetical protein